MAEPASQSSLITPKIKFFCILDGDNSPFEVEVGHDGSIGTLKKAIKKEKENKLSKIDADELVLWQVSIPIGDNDDDNPIKLLDHPDAKRISAKKAATEISEVFGTTPAKKTIHVVVQRPSAAEPLQQGVKRERGLEIEIAPKYPKYLGASSIADARIFQTLYATADENATMLTGQ
ncbi:hypothetical protein BGZ46_005146, partial [Entomortierella lignicola]